MTSSGSGLVDVAELRLHGAGCWVAGAHGASGAAEGDPSAAGRHRLRRRVLRIALTLADPQVGDRCIVNGHVSGDLTLEALASRPDSAAGKVVAYGSLSAVWRAPCRRCLTAIEQPFAFDFREAFEDEPADEETWSIVDDRIDLSDPVRQAALLSLPLAPVCGSDCRGPEPERFPTGAAGTSGVVGSEQAPEAEPTHDPRWAALDALRLDDSDGVS